MLRKFIAFILIISFGATGLIMPTQSYAQEIYLPKPGVMVNLSPRFSPAVLSGVIIDPKNPLRFDFIVNPGNSGLSGPQLTEESTKLAKYFLAGIAIPDEDLWVNLSPYEKDRIVPKSFGFTDMGRDLLAEDYILKQLTASVIYPEDQIGKAFWNRVYQKAQEMYGTTDIHVNTFNKVWVVPDKAVVYQYGNRAFIADSHLKVMLEEDFLALSRHSDNKTHSIGSQVVREIVLPLLEKEVNEGKNFAQLRQVFSAVILANWFKRTLKESLVNQVYANSKKVNGIDILDKNAKQKIYEQYLMAYKKGVFNYIKEEVDPATQNTIPRKYFSGGFNVALGKSFAMITSPLKLNGGQREYVLGGLRGAIIIPFILANAYGAKALPIETKKTRSAKTDAAMNVDQVITDEVRRLAPELPQIDEELKISSIELFGNLPQDRFEQLITEAKSIKESGISYVVIETSADTNLAKLLLQSDLNTSEWNMILRRNNLPQIFFVEPGQESTQVENLLNSTNAVAIKRQDGAWEIRKNRREANEIDLSLQQMRQQLNSNSLALFVASLVDERMARAVYFGAQRAVQEWHEKTEGFEAFSPYALALRQVAYAKTGKNISVFTMFGRKYKFYSTWLAQQMNEYTGNAKLPLFFSGEWASDYRHSTGQAQNQSIGYAYNSQIARDEANGFIGLTFINAREGTKEDPVVVQGFVNQNINVNPLIKGYTFDYLLAVDREAQRLSVSQAKRPVFDWTFSARNPEDIGRMIVFGQVAALATGKLAGADLNDTSHRDKLKAEIARQESLPQEITPIPDGTLRESQNVINVSDHRLTGVIGEKIQESLEHGDRRFFKLLLTQMARLTGSKTGLDKVIGDLKSKDKLIHLDPERSLQDVDIAEALANKYRKYRRIYIAAVGGSAFGDYLQQMLSLTDGPEIVFVTDYDGDRMKVIRDDLRRNPKTRAVWRMSKSGVTREEAANGATMQEFLWDALKSEGVSYDDIAEHFLAITDPSYSDLRTVAEELGIRTADHPEHGGRFSMLSILGQAVYFLKGGSKAELLHAFDQWKQENQLVSTISKDFSDKKVSDVLKIDLDEIKAMEDPKKREAQLSILSKNFGREVTIDTLPTQEQVDQKQIETISYILNELGQAPGIIPGFLRTFLNIMHSVESTVRYDTEVALSTGGGIAKFVTPNGPGYQQLVVETIGKPESRQYTVPISGIGPIERSWERIVANPRVFVTLHTEQPSNLEEEKLQQSQQSALWEELTAAGIPTILTENGHMNTSNLVATMLDFYWHLAIAAAQYRSVDGEGQPGVEVAKQIAEALMVHVNGEVAKEALQSGANIDVIKGKRTRVPQLSLDQVDHASEPPMDLDMLIPDSQLAENVTILLTEGRAGSEGLGTVKWRDSMLYNPNPKQKYELLRERIKTLVSGLQEVGALIIDGQEEIYNPDNLWIVRATTVNAPINLASGAACGTMIEFYRKNETGGLEAKPEVSVMIQWGSSLRVFISTGEKTQDYRLLETDNHLIEVTKPGESNLIHLSTIGKYVSFGGESLGRPQGIRDLLDLVIRPSTKLKDRHTGDLVADNNLMVTNQGFLTEWMTWGEAYNIAQFQQGVGGFALVMTEHGLRPISDFPVTEERLKDPRRIYVYAGVQNLVRQTQLWMDLLDPLMQDGAIFDFLNILATCPQEAKPTAIMLLNRIKEGLDAFPDVDKLEEGQVKETIRSLRQRVPEVLQELNVGEVVSRLQGEYTAFLATPSAERNGTEDKFLILADPQTLTQTKIKAGANMKEYYQLQRLAKTISTGALLDELNVLLNGSGHYEELVRIQERLNAYYQRNNVTTIAQPVVLPEYQWGQSLDQYRTNHMDALAPNSGVPPQTAQKILEKRREVEDEIFRALTGATYIPEVFDDPRQEQIIDELRENEPTIFERDGEGHEFIHSLLWISRNLSEKKATTSLSTDVSSRLDDIFDQVIIFRTRPKVFAIISEESIPIIDGKGVTNQNKKKMYAYDIDGGYRLVFYSDPIDGSSGVATAMAYGSIFTIGYLKPGQDLIAGDYKKRSQMLSGFHLQYSHTVDLVWRNPYDSVTGRPEVRNFALHQKRDHTLEFRYKTGSDFPSFWDSESKLDWDGKLEPRPDGDPQKAIHLALGGAFLTGELTHKVFMDDLIKTWGYVDDYGGAFLNDHVRFFQANLSHKTPFGRLYAYGLDEGKGRLRDPFEIYYMSSVLRDLDGEAINGEQPTLNLKIEGETPSQKQIPYIGGSSWITKRYMAWDFYVKQNHATIDLRNEASVRQAFANFKLYYDLQGERLLKEMVAYSQSIGENKSEMDIRYKLLTWDSIDRQDNYYPRFLSMSGREVYDKIFADAAIVSSGELKNYYGFHGHLMPGGREALFQAVGDDTQKAIERKNGRGVIIAAGGFPGSGKSVTIKGDSELGLEGLTSALERRFEGRQVVDISKDISLLSGEERDAHKQSVGLAPGETYVYTHRDHYHNQWFKDNVLDKIIEFQNSPGAGSDTLELTGDAYDRVSGKVIPGYLGKLIGKIRRDAIIIFEGENIFYGLDNLDQFDVKFFIDVQDENNVLPDLYKRELTKNPERQKSPEQIKKGRKVFDFPSMRHEQKTGGFMDQMDYVVFVDDKQHPVVYRADKAALADGKRLGGINLGTGGYLKVIDYTSTGMPVFNQSQLEQFKLNFNGFIPVPFGRPYPANLALAGLQNSTDIH